MQLLQYSLLLLIAEGGLSLGQGASWKLTDEQLTKLSVVAVSASD